MSLESWKKEFYPIPAEKAPKNNKLRATNMCLQKWIGLRAKNLEKHAVYFDGFGVRNMAGNAELLQFYESLLYIDEGSCHLCELFSDFGGCTKCPIYQVKHNLRCDNAEDGEYYAFTSTSNPEPMIRVLRLAIKMLENQTETRKKRVTYTGKKVAKKSAKVNSAKK